MGANAGQLVDAVVVKGDLGVGPSMWERYVNQMAVEVER
jgi:hypothetical protein